MVTEAQQFIEYITGEGALKFGDFTLGCGRRSPFLFNIGNLTSGEQLMTLASFYGDFIYKKLGNGELGPFNVILGPAYKGIPLAINTMSYLFDKYGMRVQYCVNRKEPKKYGDVGDLLGANLKDGNSVLIVDDVIASGRSIDEVVPLIKSRGDIEIAGVVVALDRSERADGTRKSASRLIFEKYNFPVLPIVRMDEVIKYLSETNQLTAEVHQNLRDYYADYGGR